MIKTKEQKGITLIALIITIIVLLILAVVAIGAVQNDGIIKHARNAREEYGKAQVNENITLQGYLDMIKENVPTGTVGNNSNNNDEENQETGKTITFTIWGQTYNDAVEGDTWEDWMKKQKKYTWCSDNGYLMGEYSKDHVCYEDGTRVALTDDIRAGYKYSKGLKFTISGKTWNAAKDETWEEWCKRIGERWDYKIEDGYVVSLEAYAVLTSEGEKVKKDDIIEPGHAYGIEEYIPN